MLLMNLMVRTEGFWVLESDIRTKGVAGDCLVARW